MTLIEKLSNPLNQLIKAINELETGKTFIKLADFSDDILNYDSVVHQAQRACETAMSACLGLDENYDENTAVQGVFDDYVRFCTDSADEMTDDINVIIQTLRPAIEKLLAMDVSKEDNVSRYGVVDMNDSMATASNEIELVFNILEHITGTDIPRTTGSIDRFLEDLE